MPGRPRKIPSYCHHKAIGQAVVRINGRDIYLSPFGSPESHQQYARVLGEHFSQGREVGGTCEVRGANVTINELVLLYWREFVETYHQKNGEPPKPESGTEAAVPSGEGVTGGPTMESLIRCAP